MKVLPRSLVKTKTVQSKSLSSTRNSRSTTFVPNQRLFNLTSFTSSILLNQPHTSKFHNSALTLQEKKEEAKQQQAPEANKQGEQGKKEETQPNQDAKDKKIKELEQSIEELKTNLKYSYAERENIRRMGEENARKNREYGIQGFSKSLISVHDNLSRALQSLKPEQLEANNDLKNFQEGVQLTFRELNKIFKENGIEEHIPQAGTPFDPYTMQALLEVPDPSKDSGSVAFVMKNGFLLKDRTLRAADVAITKGGPAPKPKEQKEQPKEEKK